ncbi:MAG: fatty acid desaturase [Gemmatimonadota bacterium]|nr:fatty acid desaturase [Gemmatimonadota bacterium]
MTAPAERLGVVQKIGRTLALWFDTGATRPVAATPGGAKRVEWVRVMPFVGMHLMCLGVFVVGWHPAAVATGLGLYLVRMFAITGFYHRYFSHRSYRASRPVQFLMALVGASATQRGPLWWAAHHRKHHRHSDTELDVHSPRQHGFWWSHMGWITSAENFPTDMKEVRDFARYPELRWLDRFDILVPVALAVALFALGGLPYLIWGYFVSTVVLFHGTCLINSLAHQMGSRRYATDDDSRNSLALALVTLGEGWHNNHHRYPGAARQGFFWWEVDLTYYGLVVLSWLGVIRDLRPVPARVLHAG